MSDVGLQRLFPPDLSDDHLTMLNHAIKSTSEATVEGWLKAWIEGEMRLYEFVGGPTGLIGLMRRPECIWIEIMTGRGLNKIPKRILKCIRALPEVGPIPVVMLVPDARFERIYKWAGAKRLGTLMRFTGG